MHGMGTDFGSHALSGSEEPAVLQIAMVLV